MKYYYVVFQNSHGTGAITLAHNKTENGFNIASAYEYLIKACGAGVVILSWQEINEARHNGFKDLMQRLSAHKICGADCKHQGEKSPPGVVIPFPKKD